MVKNIILSLVVIGVVIGLGFLIFSDGPKKTVEPVVTLPGSAPAEGLEEATMPVRPATTTQLDTNKKHMVTIETNHGTIVFETYEADAPNTVANFFTLAQKGFYNGLTFHRVIPGFMIQGGDPNGNGTGGPGYTIAEELNPDTASYKAGYKQGVVAMAKSRDPHTTGSQFFIMDADYPLPNQYTIFGKVTKGQEVVDEIAHVKRDQNDMPVTPVVMKKVTVQ